MSQVSRNEGLIPVLTRNAKLLGAITLTGTLVSAAGSLVMPNLYTADARVLIPQQPSVSAMLAGQANALAALSGASNPLKNPNDIYVGMLRSRNVLDGVIKKESLQQAFKQDLIDDTRERLSGATQVTAGKDNLVLIEVTDSDPKRAMHIANTYVEELTRLTTELGVTEAQSRRKFIETQVAKTKKALTQAEEQLRAVQEKVGMTDVTLDAQADISTAAALEGRIAAKQAEIASQRQVAADGNPQLQQSLAELSALRASVAKLRQPSLSGVASKGLDYVRALRDVKYQEALYEGLAKQLELAHIDESREVSSVQVVDAAVEPLKKSGPRRTLLTVLGSLVSLLLGLGVVAFRENRLTQGARVE